jgi:hypothetical protein
METNQELKFVTFKKRELPIKIIKNIYFLNDISN